MARPAKKKEEPKKDTLGYVEIKDNQEEAQEETQEVVQLEQAQEDVQPEQPKKDTTSTAVLEHLALLRDEIDRLKSEKETPPQHIQLVNTPTKENDEQKFGSGLQKIIPIEDRLKKPVTFIMRGRGFILSVYMKDGSEVYAPYNRGLRFSLSTSDIRRDGKAEETIHFSTYSTWSQKEVEYIQNSPYYNVSIFDSVTKAMTNYDSSLTNAIEQASAYVHGASDDAVLNMAQQYGIDMKLSASQIRKQITNYKIQEALENEEYFKKRNIKIMKEISFKE